MKTQQDSRLKQGVLANFDRLLNEGATDEAAAYANKITTDASTLNTLLALVDLRRRDLDSAREKLHAAIRLNKNNNLAKGYLGICEVSKKQWKNAEMLLADALKDHPNDQNFLLNKAIVHSEKQEFTAALKITEKLLKSNGGINVYSLHIGALRAEYRLEEALQIADEAITKYKESVDLKKIRADLFSELDPYKAVEEYDELEKISDLGTATKWNSSFSYLRIGKFEKGFEYYEYGLHDSVGRVGRPLPPVVRKLKRTSLFEIEKEKFLVLVTEQGIGDQVLFASALSDLISRHNKILLISDQRMIPILRRSFPEIPCHNFGLLEIVNEWDEIAGYIPIGSLFYYFRKCKEDFINAKHSYLVPDPSITAKFRQALRNKMQAEKVIGISWKGGFWDRQKKGKTLALEHWIQIFKKYDGYNFVSLQYGDVTKEKELIKAEGLSNVTFIDGVDFKKNLNAWHALISSCDKVLSISTAMVHFAAASGVEVHLLLNQRQQPFIWGLEDDESYVYDKVTIYRMKSHQTVSEYFNSLLNKLKI